MTPIGRMTAKNNGVDQLITTSVDRTYLFRFVFFFWCAEGADEKSQLLFDRNRKERLNQ